MSFAGRFTMNPIVMGMAQFVIYGSLALLPVLMMEFSLVDRLGDRYRSGRSLDPEQTFDFIVVGAGSSGAVVANRLSEKYRVLLLEAGGEPFPLMSVPALASLIPNSPPYDWAFRTVPQQKSCLSLKNQESLWPRGKGLGGTSNLNFMAYIRGHPLDYDYWAFLTGDERWNYKNFLPYFKKSEDFHDGVITNETGKYHGFGGEVNIEPGSHRPLAPYFIKAAAELGYPELDLNGDYEEGFSNFYFTSKNGRRWSAYKAYLEKIRESRKDRLTIHKYAFVTRVLLKESNNYAYGVEYERHGRLYTAKANKEIILSAGTIGTPKILMLSGIGPKAHLESLGIKPVLDLPVGQNLQDHVVGFIGPFTVNKTLTFIFDRDTDPSNLFNYIRKGTGPLSAPGVEALGFILSNYSAKINNPKEFRVWPDIQLILVGLPLHQQGPQVLSGLFNLREDIAEQYYRPVAGKDTFHIMSIVSRPKSRGQILLASKDHRTPPLIDPNYFDHPDDVNIILEGMKKSLELVENTESFKSIGAKLSSTVFPSCSGVEYRSDAYWECYLRHYSLSVYHPSGTCSMGKRDDPSAVVDTRLKVMGVPNLRVIDASIQPQIISSNIQAVCIAIGEIGSDFVKETWDKPISG